MLAWRRGARSHVARNPIVALTGKTTWAVGLVGWYGFYITHCIPKLIKFSFIMVLLSVTATDARYFYGAELHMFPVGRRAEEEGGGGSVNIARDFSRT